MPVLSRERFAAVLAMGCMLGSGCEPTNQGYAPEQPIKYSHAVHAGALEIPCQYCHYGAERGRHAGIPPAQICMNCHVKAVPEHPEVQKVKLAVETAQPIAWVRVHRLPDHAYFDHRAHVAAKVECQRCHGPVESTGRVTQWAPLTMGWCLDCHRQGAPAQAEGHAAVPAAQANRLTDCVICHH